MPSRTVDEWINPEDAKKWLENPNWFIHPCEGVPVPPDPDDPDDSPQRLRDVRNFNEFRELDDYAALIELLRSYVLTTIPSPEITQRVFWNVSCLPSTNKKTHPRLFCVSVHMMEIFVVRYLPGPGGKSARLGFVNCAESVVRQLYPTQERLQQDFGTKVRCELVNYQSADEDNRLIWFDDVGTGQRLIANPTIRNACASLNYRVMKKGVTKYGRFHCSALANALFDD